MNLPPIFFTPKQKERFYRDEKKRCDKTIKDVRCKMQKCGNYRPGDERHIESIKLRIMLTDLRREREKYRSCAKRLIEKMNRLSKEGLLNG